ncbi:MAG: tetratricopeptide repeat protein [Tabrizicola sp.]|jgi:tetratricopeptide (TPR) repeat protein|nr:tetratricopeptide repeat protein [Tabrizicola sp.]
MSLILSAANVLVGILGAVTAKDPVGGAKSALSGAAALSELYKRLTAKTPALGPRIAADLEAAMVAQHLTEAQRLLIPQMITAAPLTPPEVMAAARNPARICDAMLAKLTDPAHRTPATQDAFRRVLAPILTTLLADTAVSDTLRPAFETAVAESLAFIGQQVEILTGQVRDAFERAAIAEFVVKELARRYAPGSDGDFDQARLGLENALQTFQTMRAQNALPHNAADQVDAVLAEVQKLNDAAEFDRAGDTLAQALATQRELVAEHTSGLMRLLDSKVAQATLQNRPQETAEALVERLMLDEPDDPFEALCALQNEWFVRGRDQGLAYDLEVSIALATASLTMDRSADQRGAALLDLGIALQTIGDREKGTARLEEAVTAYRAALKELTRKRAPLAWATVQNNLGNALQVLGMRKAGKARLKKAVIAYRAALEEWTRDRVPLYWAITQNNLGNALSALGKLESGTARLEEAVEAYRAALEEQNRERARLGWAATQNNLGDTLRILGEREAGTERLEEAVTALRAALEEHTRDRLPLSWAMTQGNLGTVELAFFEKTGDPARLVAAREYTLAAQEVFVKLRAPQYVEMGEDLLAKIDQRASGSSHTPTPQPLPNP